MIEDTTLYLLIVTAMDQNSKVDRQREHQANERTFLAWLRTSVALIAFGFAIARFGLFLQQLRAALQQPSVPGPSVFSSETLGVILVIFGIVMIALAAWRYNRVFWQIEQGAYQPNRLIVWLTTGIVMILGILSLPLVFGSPQKPRSPSTPPAKSQSQKFLERQARVWTDRP